MSAAASPAIEIVAAGMATTLQDRGRPGYAHLGVPTSGAVDRALAGLVNRLVGNGPDATVIETCGGLTLRALAHVLIATSAEPAPRSLRPGDTCNVPVGSNGRLWHYVAVRGGIAAEHILGSSSRDTLSKLGPPECRLGDQLSVGPQPVAPIHADLAPLPQLVDTIRIVEGPRPRLVHRCIARCADVGPLVGHHVQPSRSALDRRVDRTHQRRRVAERRLGSRSAAGSPGRQPGDDARRPSHHRRLPGDRRRTPRRCRRARPASTRVSGSVPSRSLYDQHVSVAPGNRRRSRSAVTVRPWIAASSVWRANTG